MNKKTIVIILVLVAILIWALPAFRWYPGVSKESMINDIESIIPIGSSRVQVTAFLNGRHIENSTNSGPILTILAIQRDVCVTALLECAIQTEFEFDDRNILIGFTVREVLTGI